MAEHKHSADGPATCFGCKIKSLSLNFVGTPGGKDEFHGPTIKERQDKAIAEAKAAGRTIEPAGSRWV